MERAAGLWLWFKYPAHIYLLHSCSSSTVKFFFFFCLAFFSIYSTHRKKTTSPQQISWNKCWHKNKNDFKETKTQNKFAKTNKYPCIWFHYTEDKMVRPLIIIVHRSVYSTSGLDLIVHLTQIHTISSSN